MKHLLLLASIVLSFISCKKETIIEQDTPAVVTYQIIEMETNHGNMYIWLYDSTPLHKSNFIKLTSEGYFDSTTFHRVIPNFMIQGGDPNSKDADTANDGTGGPNYTIPAEIRSDIKHKRGVIAAARTDNPAKASSGSQFYISVSTSGTQNLNGLYTVFGYVMKGMEFADLIVNQPRNKTNNRPFINQYMKVRVIQKTLQQIKDEFGYTPEF
ncbi:MAG: peptidylprolyl isomerase [Bacteroidia bacterium]|nr:peptidylprolyl isomerase [Bacteroidia bacterium]